MKPSTFAYGEDGLTYRVLSKDLAKFLREVKDDTPPEVVIFRPSFGRGGGFGEFDAIVVTRSRIYLIEAKWDRPRRRRAQTVRIGTVQLRRHGVMAWLIKRWSKGMDWTEFRDANAAEFAKEFPGLKLPRQGDQLASNLSFVMDEIKRDERVREVVDVLLYHLRKGNSAEISVEPATFRLVILDYPTVEGSDYVALATGTEPG